MIKNIVFNSEISAETVTELMEYMDACICGTDTGLPIEKVMLNFSSPGGSYSAMMMLVNYLNSYALDLEVVAYDECYSAGLIILLYLDRDIKIIQSATGMFHLVDTYIQTREMRDGKSFSNFMIESGKNIDEQLMKDYRMCGLSEEELKRIEDGGDIFVHADRLIECIETYRENIQKIEMDFEIEALEQELATLKLLRGQMSSENDEIIEDVEFEITEEDFIEVEVIEDIIEDKKEMPAASIKEEVAEEFDKIIGKKPKKEKGDTDFTWKMSK